MSGFGFGWGGLVGWFDMKQAVLRSCLVVKARQGRNSSGPVGKYMHQGMRCEIKS